MKMIVVPAAARPRMMPNSSSVSDGREDGGRLVEDEDVALAVERLEDLDPLAHADGEVLDLRVGVDVEAVLLGQLDDPLAGGLAVEGAEGPGDALGAERDRLDDVEHGDELEVLVDHPDAGVDRLARVRRRCAASPSMRISPESGRYRPDRMFIRVVLPAPFSPSRPRTSPRSAEIEIRSLARTPGNRLVMSLSSSRMDGRSSDASTARPRARGAGEGGLDGAGAADYLR